MDTLPPELFPIIHSYLSDGLQFIYLCKTFYNICHHNELSKRLETKLRSNTICIEIQVNILERTITAWIDGERTLFNRYVLERFKAFIYTIKDDTVVSWNTSSKDDKQLIFCHTLDENYDPSTGNFKEVRIFHDNPNYRRYWNYSKLYSGVIHNEMKQRMKKEDICYLYRNQMSGGLFSTINYFYDELIKIMLELKVDVQKDILKLRKKQA